MDAAELESLIQMDPNELSPREFEWWCINCRQYLDLTQEDLLSVILGHDTVAEILRRR